MMLGIGTKKARLHVEDDFVNLLGKNAESWGMSHHGLLWHAGYFQQYTNSFGQGGRGRRNPTTIGIYFDGIAGTLTYYKDGVSLGQAFSGLELIEEPLYPIVCSTAAKSKMKLINEINYLPMEKQNDLIKTILITKNELFHI